MNQGQATLVPECTGRRERKKAATRQALQEAALRLVADRGLASVTVEEIADAADVSARTFFNYFGSKEDAVLGTDPGLADRLAGVVRSCPCEVAPLTALRSAFVTLAETISLRPEVWQLRLRLVRGHPHLLAAHMAAWTTLERALVEAVAARTGTDPDRDLYPALLVSAGAGVTRAALLRWCRSEDVTPLAALVGGAFDALAAGLPPPR